MKVMIKLCAFADESAAIALALKIAYENIKAALL